MTKIVINSDYGGFGLSDKAVELLFELKKWKLVVQDRDSGFTLFYRDEIEDRNHFSDYELERDDKELVKVVETLGDGASGRFASLKVVEIPDGIKWEVQERDGREWVAEVHRRWE